jgi:hypothetical protein
VALNENMRAGYQQLLGDRPELVEQHNIKEPPRLREGELVVVALYKNEPRLCFLKRPHDRRRARRDQEISWNHQ